MNIANEIDLEETKLLIRCVTCKKIMHSDYLLPHVDAYIINRVFPGLWGYLIWPIWKYTHRSFDVVE